MFNVVAVSKKFASSVGDLIMKMEFVTTRTTNNSKNGPSQLRSDHVLHAKHLLKKMRDATI